MGTFCIEEKLDRVLVSNAWHSRFRVASVVNNDTPPSDHCPYPHFGSQGGAAEEEIPV